MAKQVSEILVTLGIKGFEGLDRLKSSFRGLEKAIGPTDSAIQTARQSIIDFAGAGKQSIQSIQGQIEAFKGLQTQATIGGNVYRQLAGDVNRLSDTLKQLKNNYEEVGRAAKRTDAQIAAEFPARKPEAFRKQLAALNRQLDQLSVSAQTYGDKLTEITIKEIAFGRAQARQGVIAGAQAVGAPLISAMQPKQQLPNTTAALRLQISELQNDLENLDRASEDYLNTSKQISDLQKELSRNIVSTAASYDRLAAAENASIRRAEKLRNIQEYFRTQGPLASGVGGFRDPTTGSMIAAGTRAGRQEVPIERPMREISGLFQQIGQIGMQPIISQIELMGNSYEAVANDIKLATAASNGSIQSLQAQRGAWQALRAQIDPTSADFRQASKEIERLDQRLGKLQQTQSRRMTGMQMTQAAGAAISGGIFGGPEGFLGGVIGSAFGVGGAFAGAAIGAQIGGLRQQAGAVGEYVAQLNLAKTTLAQAASNQEEYNRLLQLARSVSSDYAVALRPSIEGLAQIATAAQANNLTFKETEAIYRGIIASGVAFGKSQQDLDALIRATTQVLSKGKVSAEEMSGQIGERLPGAVAKFAASTNRTLPELAKAFEDGGVTIANFVKFASDQFEEYDDVAQLIAEGPEKAGVRLQIALDTAAENFGGFFQRTGSGLQDFFANIVNWFNENNKQIKQFVTTWVNAGAAVIGVLSQIAGAFGRMMQRVIAFAKANPFLGIAQNVFGRLFGGLRFQGKFKPEDLFPEFTPPQFGGGGAVDLTGGGAVEDSSKAKSAADKAAREEERIRQRLRDLAIETQGTRQLALIKGKIAEAEIAGNRELAIRLKGEERNQQILIQLQKSLADVTDERLRQALIVKGQADLESAGMETAIEMERQRLAVIKEQNDELFKRAGFTPQDKMGRGAGAFDLSLPDLRVSPAESQMNEYRKQLEDLSDPINMAVEGADAIGSAFGQAFQSLVTGAKSAQQALSDAFKAIGEAFIQMAAEIIAKQLAMIAFQALLRAFGGGGGGFSFGGQGPVQLPSGGGFAQGFSIFTPLANAKGNAYAQNGIQPFANGGIVTKPTFFKYADGGTFSNGVMGEAGPEAIMPLKRGADGKLGVTIADTRAALAEQSAARSTNDTRAMLEQQTAARSTNDTRAMLEQQTAARQANATGMALQQKPIDVRYESSVINNVEYVTADQHRKGLAQAAERGRALTLAALQNSTRTRKKVGI